MAAVILTQEQKTEALAIVNENNSIMATIQLDKSILNTKKADFDSKYKQLMSLKNNERRDSEMENTLNEELKTLSTNIIDLEKKLKPHLTALNELGKRSAALYQSIVNNNKDATENEIAIELDKLEVN